MGHQVNQVNDVYFYDINLKSPQIRVILCGWFVFSLIVTAAYGGSLRAYIMRPRMSKPISTMEDIVQSGLPWRIPLYGETIETFWAGHPDDTVQVCNLRHESDQIIYKFLPRSFGGKKK